MAGKGREQEPDLIQELVRNPEQFEFFQAVRLIEQAAVLQARAHKLRRVGGRNGPDGEAVRFEALPSLTVPAGQITALQVAPNAPPENPLSGLLTMTVPFFGLIGPGGALPEHYTSLVIQRSHLRTKDFALRDFLNLFNHRMTSLFFRAWEKYRFPFAYERQLLDGTPELDLFTHCLYSLVGLGSRTLRDRLSFDDQVILYYGGHFAAFPRNILSLQQILEDYFELTAEVRQFCGQWLYLPTESQSSMPSPRQRSGLNLELGSTTVAGSRVWDIQSRIRIRLGALSWHQFCRLLPGTPGMDAVSQMIRLYIGLDLDYDVQLILRRRDVPGCRLGSDGGYQPMLGWNTWMGTEPDNNMDACDTVFRY